MHALDALGGEDDGPAYLLATYTAMLDLRGLLERARPGTAVLGGRVKLRVCHLYPEHLNIYADRGNMAVLTRRCEWRGIDSPDRRLWAGRSARRRPTSTTWAAARTATSG